jgi:hypothetical protein
VQPVFTLFLPNKQVLQKVTVEPSLQTNVTVLMDNPVGGAAAYVYVLTVITGWVQDAGTTSVPTVTLVGARGSSFQHALFDPWNPTFDAGSEKTFMLTTKHSLGALTQLHVWSSLSGFNPTW